MHGSKLALVAAITMLAAASAECMASSPVQPESGGSQSSGPKLIVRSIPPPEWLLWRAYYDVYRQYARRSTHDVREVVAFRLGIETSAAESLLALGEEYELEMQRLLKEEQRTPNRRSSPTYEATMAAAEAARVLALQTHRQRVAALIGTEACKRLERWLDAELKSHVQAAKIESVSPPPERFKEPTEVAATGR